MAVFFHIPGSKTGKTHASCQGRYQITTSVAAILNLTEFHQLKRYNTTMCNTQTLRPLPFLVKHVI